MISSRKQEARPLVLFSITNGWGVRNFLHTGLFETVAKFADIGVACSEDLLPFFSLQRDREGLKAVLKLPSDEPKILRWVRRIKKGILQANHNISTARIKWCRRGRGPISRLCLTASWSLLRLLSANWQLRMLEGLENIMSERRPLEQFTQPRLLVNCSPFDYRDNHLQRFLSKRSVPSISIIPSWDNPSTKGCISTCADLILAWGERQKSELLHYYPDLNSERIRISGIPQFDRYYRDEDDVGRKAFLEGLSIDPERRLILYATCSEKLFPTENEVVADLARAVEADRFGTDTHLLVRCHPADRSQRYEDLRSKGRVTVMPSSAKASRDLYSWTPPSDEVTVLATTLKNSEVCINTASTMTLDAFACGIPVVNVGYDGRQPRPYLDSVRRFYDHHHYVPITRSGAAPIARSFDEMIRAVEDALRRPERLASNRSELLRSYCFRPEAGSVAFIAEQVQRLMK